MCLNEQGVWQLHGVLSREGECRTRPHPDVFASISLSKHGLKMSTRHRHRKCAESSQHRNIVSTRTSSLEH